jgi:hypothetical protein
MKELSDTQFFAIVKNVTPFRFQPAKYLLPFDTSKINMEKTNEDSGDCDVKEKSIMQFPLITNSEDKSFYPFFTGWNEFRRFDKEQKFSGNIATIEAIKYFISLSR